MPRPYRLGKRAVSSAGTRQRVVDAAREHIFGRSLQGLNIAAIATTAGVSRSTIYELFGSRNELTLAVVNDALDRADVRRVRKTLQHPDAAVALRLLVRESCRFWADDYELFSRIKALASIDDAIQTVDEIKEGVRQGHVSNLAQRLDEQGKLRRGCTARAAMISLHLLTSYEVFDQLHRSAALSLPATTATLTTLAEESLLGQGPEPRRGGACPARATSTSAMHLKSHRTSSTDNS